MNLRVDIQNRSAVLRLYRSEHLRALAERVCAGEGVSGEIEVSLVLCDDPHIAALNSSYRGKQGPTDVLSFPQESGTTPGFRALGDIVISLETVGRRCDGDRAAMRRELDLLFCHGLLHLLGYDHHTASAQAAMRARQAHYLSWSEAEAWIGPGGTSRGRR